MCCLNLTYCRTVSHFIMYFCWCVPVLSCLATLTWMTGFDTVVGCTGGTGVGRDPQFIVPTVKKYHFLNTSPNIALVWILFIAAFILCEGHAVAQLVEALCYKSKGRGISPDEVDFVFNWPNPSGRIMALGSTQPLTEMSTRNLPGG
jgi:hypothetical protein